VKITAGAFQNAAIDLEGNLYTWGKNTKGCLIHKGQTIEIPTKVSYTKVFLLNQGKVIDASFGNGFLVTINALLEHHFTL
jgi:alpha-tubulin suppressor-like RCC1 family protein